MGNSLPRPNQYGNLWLLNQSLSFSNIRKFILFGGGNLLVNTARLLRSRGIEVQVCTAPRHFEENLIGTGATLKEALEELKIPCLVTDRVNDLPELNEWITKDAMGIGFGPAWIFGSRICDAFGNRFVNFMGIRMPLFLGGAHYTWQILRKTRVGAANFQLIEKKVNSGPILYSFEYLLHPGCNTPEDFFRRAEEEEFEGLKTFLDQILNGKSFTPRLLDYNFAQFYPPLSTTEQGWVDWSWTAEDIVLFVNAFGNPYQGASTYFRENRVFLHGAFLETTEGDFHPFQRGMIYRNSDLGLWIAAKGGSVLIRNVQNPSGETIPLSNFRVGTRFFTPIQTLEQALIFEAHYDAKGLKKDK